MSRSSEAAGPAVGAGSTDNVAGAGCGGCGPLECTDSLDVVRVQMYPFYRGRVLQSLSEAESAVCCLLVMQSTGWDGTCMNAMSNPIRKSSRWTLHGAILLTKDLSRRLRRPGRVSAAPCNPPRAPRNMDHLDTDYAHECDSTRLHITVPNIAS